MEQLPETIMCEEHDKTMKLRDGKYGKYYSHVINYDKGEYCNKKVKDLGYEEDAPVSRPASTATSTSYIDPQAEGKTRCQVICAAISKHGLEVVEDDIHLMQIKTAVDLIMKG